MLRRAATEIGSRSLALLPTAIESVSRCIPRSGLVQYELWALRSIGEGQRQDPGQVPLPELPKGLGFRVLTLGFVKQRQIVEVVPATETAEPGLAV